MDKFRKTLITRFIRLNQPCYLSDLLNEIYYNDIGIDFDLAEIFEYLYLMQDIKEIVLKPDIFSLSKEEQEELIKTYTLRDLAEKRFIVQITIPNYLKQLWNQYFLKKSLYG